MAKAKKDAPDKLVKVRIVQHITDKFGRIEFGVGVTRVPESSAKEMIKKGQAQPVKDVENTMSPLETLEKR